MRTVIFTTALAATVALCRAFCSEAPLRCAHDVARAAFYEPVTTNAIPFRFTGRVTYVRNAHDYQARIIAVEDDSGAATVTCPADVPSCAALKPGDTAEFAGLVRKRANASLHSCRFISSGEPPKPVETDISDILDGRHDFTLARFTGTLRDVAESETAPRWLILVVCHRSERIYISVPDTNDAHKRLSPFIGCKISATGVCVPQDPSRRLRVGRTFKVADVGSIRPTDDQSSTPVPDIGDIKFVRPSEVLSLGRHSAVGRVIAVWQGSRALLKLANGDVAGLELADGVSSPRFGELVRATGLPESDLYRINLTSVSWIRLEGEPCPAPAAQPMSAQVILTRDFGYRIVKSEYHGRAIALHGVVRSLPGEDSSPMLVECDRRLVPVDASSIQGRLGKIEIGSWIKAAGTCVVNQERGKSSAAFPRMDGFTLVVRTPDDIKILKRPPWWTPGRLAAIIGGLLALLLGVVVRNWQQKRTASRLSALTTALKVEERTRLAVELHDSLAQNLTGVSLEIDTAGKLAETDPKAMREHLGQATRSLKSCRDELRNCLWDLRNRALEEASLDEAIRQTLAPHVVGVDVAIRFNVPRERISDNTAHAILRSIRELAINAVRHGKATKIWIAGSIDGDNLLFSVRDNGTGFDPATAPGFAEGHYGLVGITERIEALEGEFNIESSPGSGAKATARISARRETRDTRRDVLPTNASPASHV